MSAHSMLDSSGGAGNSRKNSGAAAAANSRKNSEASYKQLCQPPKLGTENVKLKGRLVILHSIHLIEYRRIYYIKNLTL